MSKRHAAPCDLADTWIKTHMPRGGGARGAEKVRDIIRVSWTGLGDSRKVNGGHGREFRKKIGKNSEKFEKVGFWRKGEKSDFLVKKVNF